MDPLYGLNYVHALPRGVFSASLQQSVSTTSDNIAVINTGLALGYVQNLDAISSLSANFGVNGSNLIGSTGSDTQRVDMSVTYRRELTSDWGLVGGIGHTLAKSDGTPDRRSNRIFIGLQRGFVWNP